MVFQEKYDNSAGTQKKAYYNPSDLIDPETKKNDTKYFLRKMEYMYHSYLTDQMAIPYSSVADMQINRLYAQGRQPITKYLDQMCPIPEGKQERETAINISWDVYSVLPKFRSYVGGLFDKVDYALNIWGLDEQSVSDRNSIKFQAWAESRSRTFLGELDGNAGLETDSALPFDPESLDELDMLDKVGTFKLATEIGIKKCLLKSAEISAWDELKKRFLEDAFDLSWIACKDYTEPVTGEIKVEYVDPQYLIVRCSRSNTFDDITEAAQIKSWSLQDLRNYGIPEDEIKNLAALYGGRFGNPIVAPGFITPESGRVPEQWMSEIRVWGLDAEFESFDTYYYEQAAIEAHDTPVSFPLKFDKPELTRKEGSKLVVDNKRKWYRCKWIIGSNCVFDYGYQFDVPYEQKTKPRSSFHIYKVQDRSLANLTIAECDSLMMTVLKFRHWWNEASPPGLLIEWGSLQNMKIGGKTMEPMDLIRLKREKGHLIYRGAYNPVNGAPITGGAVPIMELKGGLQNGLDECVQKMTLHINNIRDLLGIGAITDGSTPNPNVPVGTSKIAEAGTNYVLKPLLSAYKNIKKRAYTNMAWRWQLQMRALKMRGSIPDTFAEGISTLYREIIAMGADVSLGRMGIFVDTLIDDDYKQMIMASATESLRAAKTGQVGITQRDFFVISRMVETGQLEIAELYLAYRERKQKEFEIKMQNDNMKQNAEAGQALEKQKSDNAKALEELKGQREIANLIVAHLLEQDKMKEAQAYAQPAAAAA